MSFFEKNIRAYPGFRNIFDGIMAVSEDVFLKARDGNLTARFEGKFLHSAYNPVSEAKKLIASYKIDEAPIIVLGFGLGYHVKEIFRKFPGRRVLVIERNIPLLKKVFELVDISNMDGKLKFYTEDKVNDIMTDHEFYSSLNQNPTIIVHGPSTFSSIKFYQNISDSIMSLNKFSIDKKVRVSVVSPIMGGSIPIANFVEAGLKELGVEVDYIDNTLHRGTYREITNRKCSHEEKKGAKAAFYRFLTDSIESRIDEFKPDLVIALAQAPVSIRLLNNLYNRGIKSALWFVENFKQMTYWKYMAAYYDYFFTIQKGEFFKQLEQNGIRNYYYLPVGACESIHKRELVDNYLHSISLVGAGYRNREIFIEKVLSINPSFDISIWGNDWPGNSPVSRLVKNGGRRLTVDQVMDTYARSKIVLNLHSSIETETGIAIRDKDYINPRTFELAAMGVFQLVDERDNLSDYFEIGREMITFTDEKDFIKKAEYYLKNDLERNEIALMARARVLKDHLYTNRLTGMLTDIFGVGVMKSIGSARNGKILENENSNKQKLAISERDYTEEKAFDDLSRELLIEQMPERSQQ